IGIVAVSVLAQAVKFTGTLILLRRKFVRFRFRIDLKLSRYLFQTSLPFGILLIIQTLQSQLGTFVLSLYYDESTVGIYGAATTIIMMLLYVPQAFASSIFPNYSRLYQESKAALTYFYRLAYKYLLVLGFPLALGTMLVGSNVVTLIYGEDFTGSAIVIQIMGLFLFGLVGYTNGPLLQATGRQRFFAWTQGGAALLNAVLCFVLVPPLGPVGAAVAFVTGGVLTFVVHSVACHRQLGLAMPWLLMGRVLLATAAMGLAVVLGIQIGLPWLLVAIGIAIPVYAGALFVLRIMKLDELKTLAGAPTPEHPLSETGA
ncbi:MAG: polysaccharide biosynthesis C-terminal domain-containing protein, partial [Anaerolineae bacterium]|nr:polysaccharide biosynthesis C-terminal domain-containing protein [Anaerolineae bacterium]